MQNICVFLLRGGKTLSNIPEWDFNIGEGSDILQTFHYYVIGDPFTLLAVFVPTRFIYLYYEVINLIKLYFSGILFSCLCFQTGKKNRFAVLAGSISYAFCYWGIYNAARHPFFLNPLIYLPMIIIGIEKIIKEGKIAFLIFSVYISAISNFYFFYMLAIISVIYVIIRLFILHRDNMKKFFFVLCRIGIASLMGVLMAAFIFVPVCFAFLGDDRNMIKNAWHLVYPLTHYSKLPGLFISGGASYWMCMGFAAPVLLAVILLFYKKGNNLLKVLFLIGVLFMSIPIFGQILNGVSYMCNRWCWAFALLCTYIFVAMWPLMMKINLKEYKILLLCLFVYCIICTLLENSRSSKVYFGIVLALIFLILIFPFDMIRELWTYKRKQQWALVIVVISICGISFWENASGEGAYALQGIENEQIVSKLNKNETAAVKNVAALDGIKTYYRFSGRGLTKNANIIAKMSSTQRYWSNTSPYVSKYRKLLELRKAMTHSYEGYDDRTALLTLASVLYYVIPVGDTLPLPYGFTYVDTIDVNESDKSELLNKLKIELNTENLTDKQVKIIEDATKLEYAVYRNEYALPLGYTYNGYIPMDLWNSLSAIEKQEALLQGAVLKDYNGIVPRKEFELTSEKLDYTISCNGNGVSLWGNNFIVTNAKASVNLEFSGMENAETYFTITGLTFQGVPDYDLYFGNENVDPLNLYNHINWNILTDSVKETIRKRKLFWVDPEGADLILKASTGALKQINYYTDDDAGYSDRHDFSVNLGYSEDAANLLTITFSNVGIYSFDTMSVVCQTMSNYGAEIRKLKNNTLENIQIGTDCVEGTISLKTPKLLCLSIPYSPGWSAYVDGKKEKLYQANIMYMALELKEGEHYIKLEYHTPLLKEGICISIVTFLCFGIYFFGRQWITIHCKRH